MEEVDSEVLSALIVKESIQRVLVFCIVCVKGLRLLRLLLLGRGAWWAQHASLRVEDDDVEDDGWR